MKSKTKQQQQNQAYRYREQVGHYQREWTGWGGRLGGRQNG